MLEALVEGANEVVDIAAGDIHWRGYTEAVAVEAAAAEEDAVFSGGFEHLKSGGGGWRLCLAVFDEFQGEEEAHAADVSDDLVLLLEFEEAIAEIGSDDGCVLAEVVVLDKVDDSLASGGGNGVASEGGELRSFDGVGDFRAGDGEADGQAVGKAFGTGDDVGDDVILLNAPPLVSGSAPGGLDFITDEDAAVFAYDSGDDLEVLFRRSDEAADALNGLGDHAGDAAGGGGADEFVDILGALHFATGVLKSEGAAVAVGVVGVDNAGLGDAAEAPVCVAGEGHTERGAAVIGVTEGDDFAGAGVAAGGDDGGFIGLCAGACEEAFGEGSFGGDGGDFFG